MMGATQLGSFTFFVAVWIAMMAVMMYHGGFGGERAQYRQNDDRNV